MEYFFKCWVSICVFCFECRACEFCCCFHWIICVLYSRALFIFYYFYLFLFLFCLTFLLEYNCFTMVCQFLLYNKVNQLYIYIYPHISSLLCLSPSHPPYPTPLGGHKARSWPPGAMWLLPTSYLFYIW